MNSLVKKQLLIFSIGLLSCYAGRTFAQRAKKESGNLPAQTLPADTALKAGFTAAAQPITDKVKQLAEANPAKQAGQLKKAGKKTVNELTDKLHNSFETVKKKPLAFNLSVENTNQYQPAISLSDPLFMPKYASVFGVNGTVQAFGIPLNINYSSNQRSASNLSGFNNNLFKFDLNSTQFTNLFQSDAQRFMDLRKNVFAGMDLTGYARQLLNAELKANINSLKDAAGQNVVASYLSDPAHLNQLLTLNQDDIKTQLLSQLKKQSANVNSLGTAAQSKKMLALAQGDINVNSLSARIVNDQSSALSELKNNPDLSKYLRDPQNLKTLNGLSQQQILEKLASVVKSKPGADIQASPEQTHLLIYGIDIDNVINNTLKQQHDARDRVLETLAQNLAKSNKENADKVISRQTESYQDQLQLIKSSATQNGLVMTTVNSNADPSKNPAILADINKAAETIAVLQKQLADKGLDTKRLLQVQKLMGPGGDLSNISEADMSALAPRAINTFQSMVAKLTAFKAGSFGNQVAGSTQNQDLFMNGAHATIKFGYTPVTVGYGSQNDIRSLKDADFQSSVYNTPRNLTYLGTELRRGQGGSLKVSFIGSVNKQYSNGLYAMPSISANNVAVTLSKSLRMGKLGDAVIDVSKTTTVYANKYEAGSEALLEKKAGLNTNANNDLFQSLALNVSHHLDIASLNMSDNVYFSYAGMGYQNPGNNGYGGGQLKMGGNIKKAFYKNKLIVNLRSDLRNQPISYTSDDQWKNFQVQIDTRYIVSKKFNVSFKYTNNSTDKKVDQVVTPVYSFQKLQLDGNATYKIGKNYSVSHFTLGKQDLSNTYAASSRASILMMNYTQSMLIRKNTLTMNIFYNRELSAYKLIGNMLNSECSYQFPVGGKLSVSSGVTYLDNTGIARQVGIRESLQLLSAGHFDAGAFVDLRKNLITPQYADLYASVRAELSLRYHLNY